jgi:hypothetical protein
MRRRVKAAAATALLTFEGLDKLRVGEDKRAELG